MPTLTEREIYQSILEATFDKEMVIKQNFSPQSNPTINWSGFGAGGHRNPKLRLQQYIGHVNEAVLRRQKTVKARSAVGSTMHGLVWMGLGMVFVITGTLAFFL